MKGQNTFLQTMGPLLMGNYWFCGKSANKKNPIIFLKGENFLFNDFWKANWCNTTNIPNIIIWFIFVVILHRYPAPNRMIQIQEIRLSDFWHLGSSHLISFRCCRFWFWNITVVLAVKLSGSGRGFSSHVAVIILECLRAVVKIAIFGFLPISVKE